MIVELAILFMNQHELHIIECVYNCVDALSFRQDFADQFAYFDVLAVFIFF